MLIRPDAPLDPRPGTAGTSVLRDARISVESGEAFAEREPSVGTPIDGVPLLRVGDTLLTTEGAVTGTVGDLDREVSATRAAAPHERGAVAVSTETRETAVAGPGGLEVVEYDTVTLARFGRDGALVGVGAPAVIGAPTVTARESWGHAVGEAPRYAGYVAIPYTRQNEAGTPYAWSAVRYDLAVTEAATDTRRWSEEGLSFDVGVNDQTAYIDVYKTHALDSAGRLLNDAGSTGTEANTGGGGEPVALVGGRSIDATHETFFLQRVQVDRGVAHFYDRVTFTSASVLAAYELGEGRVNARQETTAGSAQLNEIRIPTDPYAVPPVAIAGSRTGDDLPEKEFDAAVLLGHAGRVFFGGPTWRTLEPQALLLRTTDAFETGMAVTARFEYLLEGDEVAYGPAVTFADCVGLVVHGGATEVALVLTTEDGLYERLTPDATGAYVSDVQSFDGGRLTFDAIAYDADRATAPPTFTTVSEVTEPLAVFVGAPSRPREPRFDQFRLARGSAVTLLAPSRLDEAEGIRAHEFYAASDEGVWVVREEGDAYVTDVVASNWGVPVDPAGRAIATPVDQGLAVLGTDGAVHLLSGRQDRRISEPIDKLVGSVLGLAFDPRPSLATLPDSENLGPLLWALCTDAPDAPGSAEAFGGTGKSLFGFSLAAGGWSVHRAAPSSAVAVFFDPPETGAGLFVVDAAGGTTVIDGSGTQRTTSLWASGDLPTNHVQAVKADVNGGVYDPAERVTLRASWRHPKVVQVGAEAEPGQILREASVAHGRPFHPRARGGGIRVSVGGFGTLRGLEAGE